jgi:hypothetical protein
MLDHGRALFWYYLLTFLGNTYIFGEAMGKL